MNYPHYQWKESIDFRQSAKRKEMQEMKMLSTRSECAILAVTNWIFFSSLDQENAQSLWTMGT